jgi:hypothetical protein
LGEENLKMFQTLRQLKYPREFRIESYRWPKNFFQKLHDEIEHSAQLLQFSPRGEGDSDRIFAEVGTGLWRIQKKLAGIDVPTKEIRSALRFLEATWDALTQHQVEIRDHTGDKITGGEALKIVSFESSKEVACDQVIETIKPTIFYRDRMIQIGEVIIGRPEK